MKKLVTLLLAATTLLTVAACNKNENPADHQHEWQDASCIAPKTCKGCNATEGEVLPHNFVDGVCHNCGEKHPGSAGLEFVQYDGTLAVSGIGTCTDKDIIIPATYNGIPVTAIDNLAFLGCETIESIIIPEGVTAIGDRAFLQCFNLHSVALPNGVEYIGELAFSECEILQNIKLPTTLVSIGNEAFKDCVSLIELAIPEGVTVIGANTFYGCKMLETLTLPSTLTDIEEAAFGFCESLRSIEIPDSVVNFGSDIFACCSSLESITLPEGITQIGTWTFLGCEKLETINLPSTIVSFGYGVFEYSGFVTEINFAGTTAQWNAIQFNEAWNANSPLSVVHCKDGDVPVYPYYGE